MPTTTTWASAGGRLFMYDYRTRRVELQVDGNVTKVVFSGGTSVREFEDGVATVDYVRGSDWGGGVGGILYTARAGVPSFTHYNRRGDVTAKTDGTGTVTYQATYEAFGNRATEVGSTKDRQKSNTKDEDIPGYANEGFRFRDLETGAFLSKDPAGFVDGPNLYAYVVQNPWTKFDPEGLLAEDTEEVAAKSTRIRKERRNIQKLDRQIKKLDKDYSKLRTPEARVENRKERTDKRQQMEKSAEQIVSDQIDIHEFYQFDRNRSGKIEYGERLAYEASRSSSVPAIDPIDLFTGGFIFKNVGLRLGRSVVKSEVLSFSEIVAGSGGRLGSTSTRALNANLAEQLEAQGFKITGGGGGMFPEEFIPGPRGTLRGGLLC